MRGKVFCRPRREHRETGHGSYVDEDGKEQPMPTPTTNGEEPARHGPIVSRLHRPQRLGDCGSLRSRRRR